jgi:para-aminobenzoate synthetase/4-amino-4-deoxychorismate lyase
MTYPLNLLYGLKPPYVFLETLNSSFENGSSFLFADFEKILTFNPGDNLNSFFKRLAGYSKKGYWLAGYFTYEFGYFLEGAHRFLRTESKAPLAWIGVCQKPLRINGKKKSLAEGTASFPSELSYRVRNIRPAVSRRVYAEKIRQIKHYLKQGFTYQVNFTFKEKFDFEGSILGLYLNLRRLQPTSYTALINQGRERILSLSPELFFRINENKIIARPMKGTIKRGRDRKEDSQNRSSLKKSKKVRAENLMITDLLRNDLGRISQSVRTPRLFDIEKHKTLYQMTSTIEGELNKNTGLREIFSSLFPCGSVTGAPKIKTMELIKKLEKEPRRVYTGAIGYVSPEGESCFNVAIRTIYLAGNKGEIGVGGGIVYDSQAKEEYEEARLKAKFFRDSSSRIGLIESILWDENKGYFLLDLHLRRLENSAKYFSIPYNGKEIKRKLREVICGEKNNSKVRLVLKATGELTISKEATRPVRTPVKIRISKRRINSRDLLLYHKTTRRAFYDRQRSEGLRKGYFETLFLNERGELTEGTITNLFILKNRKLYTPALQGGLLPGVLREDLLRRGRVEEKPLCLKDLRGADKIYIGNSTRGLLAARLQNAAITKPSR